MPRKPNPHRREELEEAVVAYVLAHGIADLSLRPVADALGLSTYALVYHFGSKDGLVAMVMTRIEERQRIRAQGWVDMEDLSVGGIVRRYWEEWCLPQELQPYHRLFFEVYGLSLQHPQRFPGFLEDGAVPWVGFIRQAALRSGVTYARADGIASFAVATVTGALLLFLATDDRAGATQVVRAVADAIDSGRVG